MKIEGIDEKGVRHIISVEDGQEINYKALQDYCLKKIIEEKELHRKYNQKLKSISRLFKASF